jgi:hypothetical protein
MIANSQIIDNLCLSGNGGGIGSWGDVTIERSIISGNRAANGGGLSVFDALSVRESVIAVG